ncbi:MAG TPA: hypothetical protein VFW60_05335 [Rhodanobacteraceae bacterium]|nr:hypothetical protein [Rhodanobacteraceae bacterium]
MKRYLMGAPMLCAALLFGGMANAADGMNMYGGPIYDGAPALNVTAALVEAGGGATNFKCSTSLVAMLGQKTVDAEVAKLSKQYGAKNVQVFLTGMTYVVNDALKRATEQGIKLPPPANLHGAKLAAALVDAGTTPDGTFWSGYLFDHAVSHKLHDQVMMDVNTNVSPDADTTTHRILNQAMYDIAHALGKKNVKLASFH